MTSGEPVKIWIASSGGATLEMSNDGRFFISLMGYGASQLLTDDDLKALRSTIDYVLDDLSQSQEGGVRYEIAPQVQQCIDISEKKLASLRATNIRLEAENARILGIINYLKMHIEYVMGDNENAIPEKFWLNAMSQFIERETAALESEDK